ncbi:MAG: hypothetical protein A2W66_09235 [Deltaproteobacteria bacterium RIFCSPLOWO2_02_56_12]|nr:MAG: hypothetical protein A2W66_09235 [Deltaproteobacteria bacterium RIFCSPLOWO2_02_56_12]
MPYLIDTDWVIDLLASVPEAVQLLDRLAQDGIAISIITYMEAYQGVERSPHPEEAQNKLSALLDSLPVVSLSPAVAQRCARLRETLRKQGKRVNARSLDLIIAATALEYNLTLVTRNTEDYADVPGLKLYRSS